MFFYQWNINLQKNFLVLSSFQKCSQFCSHAVSCHKEEQAEIKHKLLFHEKTTAGAKLQKSLTSLNCKGNLKSTFKNPDFSAILTGRPDKLSAKKERQNISYAKLNRKQTIANYRCIFNSFSIKTISHTMVRRILKKHNLHFRHWRANQVLESYQVFQILSLSVAKVK